MDEIMVFDTDLTLAQIKNIESGISISTPTPTPTPVPTPVPTPEPEIISTSTSNLIAYWNFDSDKVETKGFTAYDFINGNNGIGYGDAFVDSSGCHIGRCVHFDGSTDAIITNVTTSSQEFTFTAWIEPHSTFSGYDAIIGDGRYNSFFHNNGYPTVYDSTRTIPSIASKHSMKLKVWQWNFVVAVFNSSGVYIYYNGTLERVNRDGNGTAYGPLVIGDRIPLGQGEFVGSMDEIRVFDIDLTLAQIKEVESIVFDPTVKFMKISSSTVIPSGILKVGSGSVSSDKYNFRVEGSSVSES